MKHIWLFVILFAVIFAACSQKIMKPKSITESPFDLEEAEKILYETYKPISMITNQELETRPESKVKSYEEFVDTFNCPLFEESLIRGYIFETTVDFDKDGNPVKDEDGFFVYGEGNIISYIPTIYDEGVFIKKAFIRDVDYGIENSNMNLHELVIVELSDESIHHMALGFNRINRFKMNADEKWILHRVEGTVSFAWER